MNRQSKRQPTIGLEIHVELKTKSKMFCGCPSDHFRKKPNSQTCPVCLGLPGSLPAPNKKAVDWTIMIGLALNCTVNKESKFDRKHYFYPDLPKGYQISQYDEPLCTDGFLETSQGKVRITRVHLEEDTGKLLHKKVKGKNVTLVDFNRSGVPLVEIVTEPDIHSAAQAKEFAQQLRQILRHMRVSDCDMEKGSLRLEANVSMGLRLGYKVEIKNLNSFRFVEQAVDYELIRQNKLLEDGLIPKQETRGWSETDNKTISQRVKETAEDYRYFAEPDIPPMRFSKKYITALKSKLPELPEEKKQRFTKLYKISPQYVEVLIANHQKADYAERAFKLAKKQKVSANDVASEIVNKKIDISKKSPENLVKQIRQSSMKVSDSKTLDSWIDKALGQSKQAVADYKRGKTQAIAVIIGKVMQVSSGKADASKLKSILEKKLKIS
jgi:aspartyl-tRNA(Asn)/glutamyl-tRNA(Gln) amidotransferase subunit B